MKLQIGKLYCWKYSNRNFHHSSTFPFFRIHESFDESIPLKEIGNLPINEMFVLLEVQGENKDEWHGVWRLKVLYDGVVGWVAINKDLFDLYRAKEEKEK